MCSDRHQPSPSSSNLWTLGPHVPIVDLRHSTSFHLPFFAWLKPTIFPYYDEQPALSASNLSSRIRSHYPFSFFGLVHRSPSNFIASCLASFPCFGFWTPCSLFMYLYPMFSHFLLCSVGHDDTLVAIFSLPRHWCVTVFVALWEPDDGLWSLDKMFVQCTGCDDEECGYVDICFVLNE